MVKMELEVWLLKLGLFKDKSGLFPEAIMFVMSKRGQKKG